MEWLQVKSLNELKQLGSYIEVRKEVEGAFTYFKMGGRRSWANLYTCIEEIQILVQQVTVGEDEEEDLEGYFKSEAQQYIYYLAELDGEERAEKLEIRPEHFRSKKAAKAWRDAISKKIHPDVSKHVKAEVAMSKLNTIYNDMIGR